MRLAILLILACASFCFGQTKRIKTAPGFVELPANAPEGASVSWEPRKPFDLDLRQYLTTDGAPVCVMYLQPGTYAVQLEVIDWDARAQTKTTFVIEVAGKPPAPIPPGPTPVPPKPDVTGFAKTIRDEVRKAGVSSEVANKIGENFRTVATQIAAGGIKTISEARRAVFDLNKSVDVPVGLNGLKKTLDEFLEANATTIQGARNAFEIIAEGLSAV